MRKSLVITLLVLVLSTSCLKADAEADCGCHCHCSLSQQEAYVIPQEDKSCVCLCCTPPPASAKPVSPPQNNPQPPPSVAKPHPPAEPKPQPSPSVAKPNSPSEEPSTPAKPSPSSPKYPNPWDYCQVPKWAPYIVKYRTQCWCSLEKFRGCFTEIWGAALNDYMNVGKQCCEAFKEVDENCHRQMYGRNRWFAYKLRQHCSQF
ncbi:hypothetical protein ERO13_D05G283066v2 [Gossypium hirsutum]|uniref:Mulatexin n=3 Tax=Gossypium TaxID=3633 RepID=A0ABM3A170_GOSHI|nr:mulatexin-like [Gossypium hirsutum]KAB2031337.1 hypothetical protein ES319_D05G298000v1 [Gossypium barbadense]KAG4148387.1 hypothetical protein ERO13_D05G283066v2 [Gossypium hirsutum]TYG70443.1 hypothetical protein ES288_D05G314000v1 [Gossypium darwinii]